MAYEVTATDEEWRNNLGPDRFAVLRQAATEPPFTGKYTHDKTAGHLPLRRLRSAAVLQRAPSSIPARAGRASTSR